MHVLLELGSSLATSVEIATLSERDKLVYGPLKLFRLGKGRLDLLMLDQRPGHIGPKGFSVLVRTVELPVSVAMIHDAFLFIFPLSGDPS
jgi:hypothetical protein